MTELPDLRRVYRNNIFAAGILDQDCHHEFVKGEHGRKADMDVVYNNRKSGPYLLGLILKARMILEDLDSSSPEAPINRLTIIGLANGALQHGHDLGILVQAMRPKLHVVSLDTVKYQVSGSKILELTRQAHRYLKEEEPGMVALADDVASTGSTPAQIVAPLRAYGTDYIKAYYDLMRRPNLSYLDELKVPYDAIVQEDLPNYSPENCRATGYCAQGVRLIDYGSE